MNSSPPTPININSNFKCDVCGRQYKRKEGLIKHNSDITNYNAPHLNLDTLPENNIREFKGILVHYIHKNLPNGYKNLGKKTVSVPATESQFFATFKNYIHYYSEKKGLYKCIFQGLSSYQNLSNILETPKWGKKFYEQNQYTYVVLGNDDEMNEYNPIVQAVRQKTTKKSYKPRYERGKLIIEWKKKKKIDFDGNMTQAGHIFFHFFISKITL
jgi:hypothetical protein